jgi:hypothetical protein
MIARELGWEREFRIPLYDSDGGLPLDLEWLLRGLESQVGEQLSGIGEIEAATKLGADGALADSGQPLPDEDGIETLTVFLGSNNVLPTVLTLDVKWSRLDYANLRAKDAYTVWRPTHFAAELRAVAEAVRRIRARHVLWITIPHVTIAPIARGFGGKVDEQSRYFRYYGRPWIQEEAIVANPERYPHLSAGQVRAVDSAIDQYNEAICEHVRSARGAGLDWHVIDLCGVLDRMATRRYVEHPEAQPEWWTPYEIPQALVDALGFTPTTEFLRSGPGGVTAGGIVGLDGVHPTTSGYSIIAHECIKVMKRIGVRFYTPAGEEREDPQVGFARAAHEDTLLSRPLKSGASTVNLLGMLDERFALMAGYERALRRRKQL